MGWTTPRTYTVGEIITKAILDAHVRDNLRYLKGLDGVPTTESGLIIDNAGGDEYLKLPLLSTAETGTVLTAEGMLAHDEATHRIKVHDGTAVRSVVTTVDVDDTPANGATTDPISSNWAYDLVNILTASQDLPIASAAGVWTRLGKGTANQFLKMSTDASTVGWSTVTPTSSKLGSHTRALDAVAGDVAYTGYGFQPKSLIIIGHITTTNISIGLGDSALAEGCIAADATSGHSSYRIYPYIMYFDYATSGVGQCALLKTLDADGFTLTWALLGAGIATTASFHVLAMA